MCEKLQMYMVFGGCNPRRAFKKAAHDRCLVDGMLRYAQLGTESSSECNPALATSEESERILFQTRSPCPQADDALPEQ